MPQFHITNLDDPRLAVYRTLKATNETRNRPQFVVEGEKLLDDLLASRYPAVSAVCIERHAERITSKLPGHVPLYVLPNPAITDLVGYNFHQGVVACGTRVAPQSLAQVLRDAGPRFLLVIAPTLQNPENLGSIIRSIDVFGAAGLLLGSHAPDPLSRRVLRVSMGTALRVPVVIADDPTAALAACDPLQLVAAVADDAQSLEAFATTCPDRLAIVLGSEAHGLDADWISRCHHRITIPMRQGAESLNVGVAAAILLYRLAQVSCPRPTSQPQDGRVTLPIPTE